MKEQQGARGIPMASDEPTAIMAEWLVAEPEFVRRLRRFYEDGGTMPMRADAQEYLQVNASSNPTARRLLRWGIDHGPSRISRYRMLEWVFDRVDWRYLAAQLPPRTRPPHRNAVGTLPKRCRDAFPRRVACQLPGLRCRPCVETSGSLSPIFSGNLSLTTVPRSDYHRVPTRDTVWQFVSSGTMQGIILDLHGYEGAVPRMVSDRDPLSETTDRGPPVDAVPDATGRRLLRLRWLLSGAIALTFALGRPFGGVVQGHYSLPQFAFDMAGDLIGGIAVWISLTWAYRQGRQHRTHIAQALEIQRALNKELQRANDHLGLLSDVNRRIAESLTVDDLLDAAIAFSRQLVPVHAAALVLTDSHDPLDARVVGATPEELARFRAMREAPPAGNHHARAQVLKVPRIAHGTNVIGTCVLLPLDDGVATEGWIELYLAADVSIADDELALLETIAGVITEAIVNARRRAREQRALYELERAIAEERARIARDIHDGIAQTLAFQRMRIELWQEWIDSDPARLRAELNALKLSLREQIGELRRAIFALRPVQFDTLGFIGGLRRYITDFANQQGWAVDIDFHDVPSEFSPELEAACFRVIQEALTNSAKHAAATRVSVVLDEVDTGVRIIVRDNGHGFDPVQAATDTSHVGLRQMEERLAALRGQLTLRSRHGAGTEVAAWIPLIPERYEGNLPERRHP